MLHLEDKVKVGIVGKAGVRVAKIVSRVLVVVAGYGLISASNCQQTAAELVTIHYREVAHCGDFWRNPHDNPQTSTNQKVFPGKDSQFVVYVIDKIDNNESQAKDWPFTVSKLYVNTSPRATPGTSFDSYADGQDAVVTAHTSSGRIGRVFFNVPSTDAVNNLFYASGPNDHVLFDRTTFTTATPNGGECRPEDLQALT